MRTHGARLAIVVFVVAIVGAVGVVEAQEWRIHLRGKVDPIVARFYAEESPWIFYRDDESMYVFAVGCDRVTKIVRDGREIPLPACPVERVPTTYWRLYLSLLELEGKRLDDSLGKLRSLTSAYNAAVANASIAARNARDTGRLVEQTRGLEDSLGFLNAELDEARGEVDRILKSVDTATTAAMAYAEQEKGQLGRRRYFFAPR
jgi:hypothetical protein